MNIYLFPLADRNEKKAGASGGRHAPQYRKTSITMIVYMKYMIIYVVPPADRSEKKAGVSGGRHAPQYRKTNTSMIITVHT